MSWWQAERVQAQYRADKKRWEEEMEVAQQSTKTLRTKMEEEKAQLIQLMQTDRKRWEEERETLKREIAVASVRLKRLDEYLKDPFQLIVFAIRRILAMEEESALTI